MERYSMFLGGRIKIMKMHNMKCNLQIQCDLYQSTNGTFHRTRPKSFTIHMEAQKIPNSQSCLEKKNGAGGINLPDFNHTTKLQSSRQYGTGSKKNKYRPMNKIGSPEINSHIYGYLIFDKGGKNIQWNKTASSISDAGKTGQIHAIE